MSLEVGIIGGIVEALAPVADPEVIAEAVNDYLEDHPEATCPIDDTAGEGDTGKVWSADKTATEVEGLKEAIMTIPKGVEWKFSGSDLLLGFGFSDTLDYVIVMNNGRANGLFDFAKLCTKEHGTSLENLATADLTVVWNSGTDMHSPFQFLAVNNADGYHDDAVSASFTGGNHTLDSMGSGFETASSVYVHFYADGVPVSSGNGFCSKFEIRWANDVQAYNTVKQGGGGRACLREFHDMIFDGVTFRERITLKALEAIKLSWYDGIQIVSIGTTYTNIAFVDATNRGTFLSSDNDIKSGNAVTSGMNVWGDTHRAELNVDTNVDLGKRTYYSGTSGAHASSSSTKGYFSIIGTTVNVSAGEMFYLDGSFRFLQQISDGSKPCTGLTLNKSSISFDTIDDTDTLTATPTPADTTDAIVWSTSDSTVATVSNGVVTAKGNGTATITATCGTQSDTCSVSVSASSGYNPTWVTGKQAYKATTSEPVLDCIGEQSLGAAAYGCVTSGNYSVKNSSPAAYPYPIPSGATKVAITASGMYIGMWFSDSSTAGYSTYASIVEPGNNASSSSGIADSHTYTIPQGADSFVMTVRMKSGANISASDLENVEVSFLTE